MSDPTWIWALHPSLPGQPAQERLRVFASADSRDGWAGQKPEGSLRALADLSTRIVLIVIHTRTDPLHLLS
jgi:hypothetical protein